MTRTQQVARFAMTAVAAISLGLTAGCNDTQQAPGDGENQEQERQQEERENGGGEENGDGEQGDY